GDLRVDPAVVVAQVPLRVLVGVGSEREVGERGLARRVLAAGRGPGRLDLLDGRGELGRIAAAHDPAGAVLGGPPERGIGAPADQQLGRLVHVGADRPGVALLLARPHSLHLVELAVERAAARVDVDAADLVVVLAAAGRRAN